MSGLQHPILAGISFDLTVRTTGIKRSWDSSSIARRNNVSHRHGLKEVGFFNNGSNTVQVICSSAGTKTEAVFQDTPSGHLGSHGKRKRTNSSRILNSFIGCCGSLNMAIAEGVPNMEISHLHIPLNLWEQVHLLLRDRSAGQRESGAVILGTGNSTKARIASKVLGYHELCDDRATDVFVELSEAGKLKLYSQLEREKLQLVAMVHTHPGGWVGLSPIDQANQLSSRVGFWSIVLPHFGKQPWDLDLVGFHIRQNRGWHQLAQEERALTFHLA